MRADFGQVTKEAELVRDCSFESEYARLRSDFGHLNRQDFPDGLGTILRLTSRDVLRASFAFKAFAGVGHLFVFNRRSTVT